MTAPMIARCPRCGVKDTIFIRDGAWEPGVDSLVCFKSCREGVAPLPHDAPPPPRQLFGRR